MAESEVYVAFRRATAALAVFLFSLSCSPRSDREAVEQLTLTAEEETLVALFVAMKSAEAAYLNDPVEGEKRFQELEGEWSSAKLDSLMDLVGQRPERWRLIFETIEARLYPTETGAGGTRGPP